MFLGKSRNGNIQYKARNNFSSPDKIKGCKKYEAYIVLLMWKQNIESEVKLMQRKIRTEKNKCSLLFVVDY